MSGERVRTGAPPLCSLCSAAIMKAYISSVSATSTGPLPVPADGFRKKATISESSGS